MFTKVLAATDEISFQDAPVLIAERIAEQNNAGLHIVHAIDPAPVTRQDPHRHPDEPTEKARVCRQSHESSVRHQISGSYPDWTDVKEDFEIKVVTGSPLPEIAGYAREIDADLVVAGHHAQKIDEAQRRQEDDGHFGSTASGLIKRVHCPVMIVNDSIDVDRLFFRRIIVGIDFSKSCECALAFAASLAKAYHGKLFVFHMIPIPPYPKYSTDDYQADLDATDKRLRALCEQFAHHVDCEPLVIGGGHPHLEILKWARKRHANIIVMGSHTKDDEGKWYPGNAVDGVSAQSQAPVFVISDPTSLQPWGTDRSKHI